MRRFRGRFLKALEEQIVVLRPVPQYEQDDLVTGVLTFCECPYPRKAFTEIVAEKANQKICILKNSLRVDPDGIVVVDSEYLGNILPPNENVQDGDLVLRIDKGCQELYIEGISEVEGLQQLTLANRSKTDNARF